VEELVIWLKSQHKGLQTYTTFQQKVLEAASLHKNESALSSLLAMLVGRFVANYEQSPLSSQVAEEAHRRLVALTEKAANFQSLSSDGRLDLLNDIASSDLS